MNLFRRPSSSRTSSESAASTSSSSSASASRTSSRSAASTRYSSDASFFGSQSTRVQNEIVGNFIIREIYDTQPNGWYLRVQLVGKDGKVRRSKGKGRRDSNDTTTQFSIPITKKSKASGIQWDLSELFDAEYPDWRENEKTRNKLAQEYHIGSVSYYEYAARRRGGSPPRQVCQFEMEKQIKQQYSLLRRLLNSAILLR